MNFDQAKNIKLAISQLYDTNHGRDLIEYLENIAGHFAPNYDPESSTSIILAAGRTEVIQTIRNFNRLTEEQILELHKEGI